MLSEEDGRMLSPSAVKARRAGMGVTTIYFGGDQSVPPNNRPIIL